ncbi:hypothetical protein Tco_1296653 [Tanacetum coccineum]
MHQHFKGDVDRQLKGTSRESLNVQDVKTNLFWEFGKFTSRDGESMESYYSRFYKLMNELTRNNLQVSPMQVNVQFLQQLQPECNDIRLSERLAKCKSISTSCAAQTHIQITTIRSPKPQRSNAPSYKQSSSTRSSATTRHKGKEIAKPVTPQSESVSEEDSDPEQARRDKDMQKNLALLLRIWTLWQGMQIPKRVKDYAYHKEKMMMCKQAEQGVPLQAEQADWLEDTDEEIDEQELEAHYSYMAKIQRYLHQTESSSTVPIGTVQNQDENDVFCHIEGYDSEQNLNPLTTHMFEKDDKNVIPDSSNICTNDNQVYQNAAECVDERAALA